MVLQAYPYPVSKLGLVAAIENSFLCACYSYSKADNGRISTRSWAREEPPNTLFLLLLDYLMGFILPTLSMQILVLVSAADGLDLDDGNEKLEFWRTARAKLVKVGK